MDKPIPKAKKAPIKNPLVARKSVSPKLRQNAKVIKRLNRSEMTGPMCGKLLESTVFAAPSQSAIVMATV